MTVLAVCRLFTSRFNSATTFQPWKRNKSLQKFAGIFFASIRPRLFSRGNVKQNEIEVPSTNCFNSATTFQPWKRGDSALALLLQPMASIRPRLFSRGNDQSNRFDQRKGIASIRPRLFSRGNTQIITILTLVQAGFNSATTFQPWKPRNRFRDHLATTKLQFGHDFSAVETH